MLNWILFFTLLNDNYRAVSIFDGESNNWSVVAEFLLNGFDRKYILSIIELNGYIYLVSFLIVIISYLYIFYIIIYEKVSVINVRPFKR